MGTFRTPVAKRLSDLVVEAGDWQILAACRESIDPDSFFEGTVDNGRTNDDDERQAVRNLCNRCPVQEACLEAGLDEPYGVWGGLTSAERRALVQSGYRRYPRLGS